MKWSKLRQRIHQNFAESVFGRVELFSTSYNNPKSSSGRAWITLDGVEIVNFSTMESGKIYQCIYHESTPTNCKTHPKVESADRTEGLLIEKGEFSRFDLHNCCFEYLNLTVEEALNHSSPIINSLAVLDKRLGKRRLPLIERQMLHPLTRMLLEFRLVADGLIEKQDNKA